MGRPRAAPRRSHDEHCPTHRTAVVVGEDRNGASARQHARPARRSGDHGDLRGGCCSQRLVFGFVLRMPRSTAPTGERPGKQRKSRRPGRRARILKIRSCWSAAKPRGRPYAVSPRGRPTAGHEVHLRRWHRAGGEGERHHREGAPVARCTSSDAERDEAGPHRGRTPRTERHACSTAAAAGIGQP